jgi:hypothetical protein
LKKHDVPHVWKLDDHGIDGAIWAFILYHFARGLYR